MINPNSFSCFFFVSFVKVVQHKRAIKKIRAKQKLVLSVMRRIATVIGNALTASQSCTTVRMVWCLLESIEVLPKDVTILGDPIIARENNLQVSEIRWR